MNPETPLETARRLWPGEWTEQAWGLSRNLGNPHTPMVVLNTPGEDYRWANDHSCWRAELIIAASGPDDVIAEGRLGAVIERARDKVQSMARDFARASGLS